MVDVTDCTCIEWLPIFKRLELVKGQWVPMYYPPNMCDTRDIPEKAIIHPSVEARMEALKDYRPMNQGFPILTPLSRGV